MTANIIRLNGEGIKIALRVHTGSRKQIHCSLLRTGSNMIIYIHNTQVEVHIIIYLHILYLGIVYTIYIYTYISIGWGIG
jgi:hypothetical protein